MLKLQMGSYSISSHIPSLNRAETNRGLTSFPSPTHLNSSQDSVAPFPSPSWRQWHYELTILKSCGQLSHTICCSLNGQWLPTALVLKVLVSTFMGLRDGRSFRKWRSLGHWCMSLKDTVKPWPLLPVSFCFLAMKVAFTLLCTPP
jgi:hypothetical protein